MRHLNIDLLSNKLTMLSKFIDNSKYMDRKLFRVGLESTADITLPDAKHLTDETVRSYAEVLGNRAIANAYMELLSSIKEAIITDINSYSKKIINIRDKVTNRPYDMYPSKDTINIIKGMDKETIKPILETLSETLSSLYNVPEDKAIDELSAYSFNSYHNLRIHVVNILYFISDVIETILNKDNFEDKVKYIINGKLISDLDNIIKNDLLKDPGNDNIYYFRRVHRSIKIGFEIKQSGPYYIIPINTLFDLEYADPDNPTEIDFNKDYETFMSMVNLYTLADPVSDDYYVLDPMSIITTMIKSLNDYSKLVDSTIVLNTEEDVITICETMSEYTNGLIYIGKILKHILEASMMSIERQNSVRSILTTISKL